MRNHHIGIANGDDNSNSLVIDTSTHRSNQNLHLASHASPASSIVPGRDATVTLRSPSGTLEINGNYQHPTAWPRSGSRVAGDKLEVPLPFGFHMDLDFLRCCSEDLSSLSGESLSRLRELRKQRRKQRKTLEALVGIQAEQQRMRVQTMASVTRYATTGKDARKVRPTTDTATVTTTDQVVVRRPLPVLDLASTEFVSDGLKEVVRDFENHLNIGRKDERTQSRRDLSVGNTKTSRFNTFPRALSSPADDRVDGGGSKRSTSQTTTFKMFRHLPSNFSSVSSVASTASSAQQQNQSNGEFTLFPGKVNGDGADTDTESIASITSEMSTATLRNVREQMARSLAKLREYEKQVEAIPVMQAKLSVLKEERRLLILELKQRELKMQREEGEEDFQGELEGLDQDFEYDTEEEDLEERGKGRVTRSFFHEIAGSRARSESPYARGGVINPDEFISVQKKRSVSANCGYNSDSDVLFAPMSDRYRYSHRNWREEFGKVARSLGRRKVPAPKMDDAENDVCQQPPQPPTEKSPPKKLRDALTMTDPLPEPPPKVVEVVRQSTPPPPPPSRRDRAVNTDPLPRPPPPPRKISHGTNTLNARMVCMSTETLLGMHDVFTRQDTEQRVQEAVFRTEEEILGCPLLQRAMTKVEEEAIHGEKREPEKAEAMCQVGEENLRPFVISVGLQCKLDDSRPIVVEQDAEDSKVGAGRDEGRVQRKSIDPATEKLVRSVGVGDYKLVEDLPEPAKFKDAAVCTEKWVEVIMASKQTDTEDFAFKDTESPRVADLFRFEPSPERVVVERRSSLRRQGDASSPSLSRKSSANSPIPSRRPSALTSTSKSITRSQGTMTVKEEKPKVLTRDAKVGASPTTKSVSTSAMTLPGLSINSLPAPGSPLTTPERERLPVNICDKCDSDIQKVAKGVLEAPSKIQPPSPDMPWLSKIPRPVGDSPTGSSKLKSASSIGNLTQEDHSKSSQPSSRPDMQRSKSSLTPLQGRRRLASPGSTCSPIPVGRRDVGTPPPHPATPPLGATGAAVRRIAAPLARSQSPHAPVPPDKRSLIPKLSPGPQRKQIGPSNKSSTPTTPTAATTQTGARSLIPRVVTPPALRKMYPQGGADKLAVPDRNVVRKNTYTKINVGLGKDLADNSGPSSVESDKVASVLVGVKEKEKEEEEGGGKEQNTDSAAGLASGDKTKEKGSSGYPLPGAALFTPIDENRKKAEPSKEMKAALKVLNDSIGKASTPASQVTNAVNIIQQEWFRTSSTKQSNPLDVEDYLDAVEAMTGKGTELLARVVNMTDVNGNTALHYSVSHGNFDVTSILLDSKVANPNVLNKAGYTCIMLVSLAKLASETHKSVVGRLFSMGDVNSRATQHGQTALMLAAAHGRLDMVELLINSAGADMNVRDEDGSTALMCAAEHGHMDIVKFLLQQPETNVLAKDNDGLTALAVAMEAGHRDVGVVLYANMSFSRGASPYSSLHIKRGATPTGSRTSTPTSSLAKRTPPPRSPSMGPTPPLRTRRGASNQ